MSNSWQLLLLLSYLGYIHFHVPTDRLKVGVKFLTLANFSGPCRIVRHPVHTVTIVSLFTPMTVNR